MKSSALSRSAWSDPDLADLKELAKVRVKRGWFDWEAMKKRFPSRSRFSIYNGIRQIGMTRKNSRHTWTTQDKNDLTRIVLRGTTLAEGGRQEKGLNWKAITKRFPKLSKWSVTQQIRKLGLCYTKDKWSDEDKALLRSLWLSSSSTKTLLSKFPNRTKLAIYDQATSMGLYAGPPQGFVSIRSLALDPKWGFGYVATLSILRRCGVRVTRYNHCGGNKARSTPGIVCVDQVAALEAVESWMKMEEVKPASQRLGVTDKRLWRWLELENKVSPKGDGKRRVRFPPEVYDYLYAKYSSEGGTSLPVLEGSPQVNC